METIFKEGDRVFHIFYGWGSVIRATIVPYVSYLKVKFDLDSIDHNFTDCRLLSFTEYTLEGFSQERPEELPKIGDIVWVKDAGDIDWSVGYFKGMVGKRFNCGTRKNDSYVFLWDHLTTQDPYADGE